MNYEQLIWISVLGTFVLCIALLVRGIDFLTNGRRQQKFSRSHRNGGTDLIFVTEHRIGDSGTFIESYLKLKEEWVRNNPTKKIVATSPLTKTTRWGARLYLDGMLIEYETR